MVVGEVIQGVLEFVYNMFAQLYASIPPKVKNTFLFLFIIALAGFLLPLLFRSFGYHCDGNADLYKVSVLGFKDNIQFIFKVGDAADSLEQSRTNATKYENRSVFCPVGTIVRCSNCTYDSTLSRKIVELEANCTSSGYQLDSYNFFQKLDCFGIFGQCAPPQGWFWNHTVYDGDGAFQCYQSEDFCDVSRDVDEYNDALSEAGTLVPLVVGSDRFELSNMVSIGCGDFDDGESLEPQLKLFSSLNIFDLQMWSLLVVLTLMMTLVGFAKANR